MGLSPLCTVGAAEFEPPASGRTALFSIAMEFDVFSLALPVVAEDDVVQLVSCLGSMARSIVRPRAPLRTMLRRQPPRRDTPCSLPSNQSRFPNGTYFQDDGSSSPFTV